MDSAAVDHAMQWAQFYRDRGYNPLPSRMDAKRPLCRFAQWWDAPAPASLFVRFPTTNVQLMTGRRWRLLVIDLDGVEARDRFLRLANMPRTWVTHSRRDGWHWWFSLPDDYPFPLPKAVLWRGEGNHSAVERLCDESLVMAPPSIHPTTGVPYRFLDRAHSPIRCPMPAPCPAWILGLQPAVTSSVVASVITPCTTRPAAAAPSSQFRRDDVLAAIRDKPAVARTWGLRLAGRANARGWVPCHAIDRPDSHPSAAIHQDSGFYVDHGSGTRMSFLDLAVSLGAYTDFHHALASLGCDYASRN